MWYQVELGVRQWFKVLLCSAELPSHLAQIAQTMLKYQFRSLGEKKKRYAKIVNGNFLPVLEFPHLSFRIKRCQDQRGTRDRLCCKRLQQEDKRQVRQYFVLASFRQSLQARAFISVQRARPVHPRAQQKGSVSSKGSSKVPLWRKKPDFFFSRLLYFLFIQPFELPSFLFLM